MGILSLPRDWVRRCVFYLACGIASLSCATHSLAGSGDVPARFAFHYRQYKEADRPEEQNAYVTLAVKTELDPGVSEEIRTALGFDRPDNLSVRPTSSAPLYAVPGYEWNGEGGIVLMVDESQGTDSGYDTLFMDMNYDGILAEDKKLVGRRRIELKAGGEERARVDFPLAQISLVPACIPHGEELVSYVRPTIFPGDPPVIELAFAADYCQGEIESDQRYNAILVDFDMSGRFDAVSYTHLRAHET